MTGALRPAFAAMLLLAACGFEPVLTAGGAPAAIRLAEPDGRLDFVYRSAIEDRLGPGDSGAPILSWIIAIEDDVIAVTDAEATRRVQIVGTADWTLTDAAGSTLAAGREDGFTSWSATGTTVSVRAAERDAEERLMRILADRTLARLTIIGAAS